MELVFIWIKGVCKRVVMLKGANARRSNANRCKVYRETGKEKDP